MGEIEISVKGLTRIFQDRIKELQEEPEFQWAKDRIKYAVDGFENPSVKLSVGNVPLDYDLWKGLRNPAIIGLYPAGLKEIWEFYANRRKERVDEYGRQTIFQIPRSFNFALRNYNRAVLISVMLPFSFDVLREYNRLVKDDASVSSHLFKRMYQDVNLMINKSTSRVAIDLVKNDNMVLAMDDETVATVSKEAIPMTHQGASHGPSKGGNYPQKSLAVLTGLGQFGVSRLVFRDELVDGTVQRFIGPIRSIVMFDKMDIAQDFEAGIIYPTDSWREFLFNLSDFTNTSPEVNKYRFCSYIPYNDSSCDKCIKHCPSSAQANSTPQADGKYSEQISRQTHRFLDGKLQFDYGRCCEKRGQMASLFSEWSCARCISACGSEGTRRVYSAENFYYKKNEFLK